MKTYYKAIKDFEDNYNGNGLSNTASAFIDYIKTSYPNYLKEIRKSNQDTWMYFCTYENSIPLAIAYSITTDKLYQRNPTSFCLPSGAGSDAKPYFSQLLSWNYNAKT